MTGLDNHCAPGKCCICVMDGMCLTLDEDFFVLADKDTIEERLTRTHYQSYERALMVKTLNDMEMESRETKEKEMMSVSIKAVDIEKEKEAAREEGYKQGLEEAWEIARKIVLQDCDGGYGMTTLIKIFGNEWVSDILKGAYIHEVKEKIAAYEAEQSKPKLGDVVKIYGGSGEFYHTGIFIEEEEQDYIVLSKVLHHIQAFSKINFRLEKTGKHFDIQSMLDEIG